MLTVAGQAIVERRDLRAIFHANPGPGVPTTFPATLALAAATFTAMLQLSLVCERWPLGGLGWLRSGTAALAVSWAIGTRAYFLFANLDAVPATERAAAGPRNPGGPIAAPDFGSALTAVGSGRWCSSSPCAAGPSTSSPGDRGACSPTTSSSSAPGRSLTQRSVTWPACGRRPSARTADASSAPPWSRSRSTVRLRWPFALKAEGEP